MDVIDEIEQSLLILINLTITHKQLLDTQHMINGIKSMKENLTIPTEEQKKMLDDFLIETRAQVRRGQLLKRVKEIQKEMGECIKERENSDALYSASDIFSFSKIVNESTQIIEELKAIEK